MILKLVFFLSDKSACYVIKFTGLNATIYIESEGRPKNKNLQLLRIMILWSHLNYQTKHDKTETTARTNKFDSGFKSRAWTILVQAVLALSVDVRLLMVHNLQPLHLGPGRLYPP